MALGMLGGLGGGSVGSAVVNLILNDSGFNAGLNKAQAQLQGTTASMGQSVSKFGTIAKTAMVAGAAAFVAFAVSAVKAAAEAEVALAKLDNSLANNANMADKSRQSYIDLASDLQSLTGVSDEAVLGVEALLGAFEMTGAQIQAITPLIVDLSLKMGVDMEAAAKAVGKAFQGTTGGLQRMIGEIAAGADGVVGFTDVLGALEQKVGGFGKAFGETFAGQVKRLGASFDEFKETVGAAIIPILETLMGVLSALSPVLSAVGNNMGIVAAALAVWLGFKVIPALMMGLASALVNMGTAGATAASGLNAASFAMSSMAGPITVAVAAAAGLLIVLKELGLMGNVMGAFDPAALTSIAQAIGLIGTTATSGADQLAAFEHRMEQTGQTAEIIERVFNDIHKAVEDFDLDIDTSPLDKLGEKAGTTAAQVLNAFDRIRDSINALESNLATVLDRINWEALTPDVQTALQPFIDMLAAMPEELGVMADSTKAELADWVAMIADAAGMGKEAITELLRDMGLLAAFKATPKIEVDAEGAKAEINMTLNSLQGLAAQSAKPTITADGSQARSEIDSTKQRLMDLGSSNANPTITTSGAAARSEISTTKQRLMDLGESSANPGISADGSQARSEIDTVKQRLMDVGKVNATPKVTVSHNAFEVASAVNSALNNIPDEYVTVHVQQQMSPPVPFTEGMKRLHKMLAAFRADIARSSGTVTVNFAPMAISIGHATDAAQQLGDIIMDLGGAYKFVGDIAVDELSEAEQAAVKAQGAIDAAYERARVMLAAMYEMYDLSGTPYLGWPTTGTPTPTPLPPPKLPEPPPMTISNPSPSVASSFAGSSSSNTTNINFNAPVYGFDEFGEAVETALTQQIMKKVVA